MTERERARWGVRPEARPNPGPERLTHGRHCPCSSCCRQDWSEPQLANKCGMHGVGCPPVYDPFEGRDDLTLHRVDHERDRWTVRIRTPDFSTITTGTWNSTSDGTGLLVDVPETRDLRDIAALLMVAADEIDRGRHG